MALGLAAALHFVVCTGTKATRGFIHFLGLPHGDAHCGQNTVVRPSLDQARSNV